MSNDFGREVSAPSPHTTASSMCLTPHSSAPTPCYMSLHDIAACMRGCDPAAAVVHRLGTADCASEKGLVSISVCRQNRICTPGVRDMAPHNRSPMQGETTMPIKVLELHHHGIRIGKSAEAVE